MIEYMKRKGLVFRSVGEEHIVRECPFCPRPHRNQADNLWKLYVKQVDGAFFCHRCGAKGSWFDFKKKLDPNLAKMVDSVGGAGVATHQRGAGAHSSPQRAQAGASDGQEQRQQRHQEQQRPASVWPDQEAAAGMPRALREDHRFASLLNVLTGSEETHRGLSADVLQKYGVGAAMYRFADSTPGQPTKWVEEPCVTFPWLLRKSELGLSHADDDDSWVISRIKARSLSNKSRQRLDPGGGSWGLFGWHTVPADARTLVMTEGEFDAMAVHQSTGLPAVSLPNGCRSLPVELLPILERFELIYLWMDDDVPGQEGANKFAQKLGAGRCLLVPGAISGGKAVKDANDALRAGIDLQQLVDAAAPLPHKQILTFEELRDEILREISNPLQVAGVQSTMLPSLNRTLKGHRLGEMTVLTGPTGAGKTTLLSQISIDYCQQGVNTLWGSFEIKNTRLAKKMLTQFAGFDLDGNVEEFEVAADRFGRLPLYFLRFFGSSDVDEVLDAMDHAVYVYDVQHIVLDNLQFMMTGAGKGYEKFDMQERALDKFRKFASNKNVHLTLVIHPRKEAEDQKLRISSVFGTAKATQEADNVLIIQNNPDEADSKFLEIKKNRFDGELATIPLSFHRQSNCFVETDDQSALQSHSASYMHAESAHTYFTE